jgi:putative hydrolase of the HAD superfamily
MTRAPTVMAGSAADGPAASDRRGFAATRVWIFDLDNTLYPSECNLFAQVDQRMGEFISKELGLPFAQARHLQKAYYKQFGTTLTGLMKIHKMPPGPFLEYVHDIDLAGLHAHPELAAAIRALPGRRLIFTNGSRRHAERVAEKLGVLDLFEDICDIEACEYWSKPQVEAFDRMVRRHGVTAREAAMFEDMPPNLVVPHTLGMTTVLVRSTYIDHPAHTKAKSWATPPEHVHHMTDNLAGFLVGLSSVAGQGEVDRVP